jgi:hypothetical protein
MTAIRRFRAHASIVSFAVTPDESILVLAGCDGSLEAYEISTGATSWNLPPAKSGLQYIYDISFAFDGSSLTACDYQDQLRIYETRSGRQLGVVRFPPGQTTIVSAALAPDGRSGVFVELGGRVFLFDAVSCQMTDTGVTGTGPIRFSCNGKHVAFRFKKPTGGESLRILDISNSGVFCDLGQFVSVRSIRPTADGCFLATVLRTENVDGGTSAGVMCDPAAKKLVELWSLPIDQPLMPDFAADGHFGVTTDYRLVTQLLDLRTGKVMATVDNSPNYRPVVVTYTSKNLWTQTNPAAIAATVLGFLSMIALALIYWTRPRREAPKPTEGP